MTKEEFIQIAKSGFPVHVQELIDFENCEIFIWGNVFRLFNPENGFFGITPKKDIISIVLNGDFVQFSVGSKAFNHYSAIKEMIKLKLIK